MAKKKTTTTTAKTKKDKPEDVLAKKVGPADEDRSAAQLACIVQQRSRVALAAADLAKAAQEKKLAQAEYDAAVKSLLNKIDQPSLPGMELEDDLDSESNPNAAAANWRKVTLDELGITGREKKALEDAGLATLGEIADYTKKRSQNGFESGLSGIKGLGQSGQDKVEKALDDYWYEHPDAEWAKNDEAEKADDSNDDNDDNE